MSDALRATAASAHVDKSEDVHDLDGWLEALGGASVRIANALNTSHHIQTWDMALRAAPRGGYHSDNDDLLVAYAEDSEARWCFPGGPQPDELPATTTALVAILFIQRANGKANRWRKPRAHGPSSLSLGGETLALFELESTVTVAKSDAVDGTYEVVTTTSIVTSG